MVIALADRMHKKLPETKGKTQLDAVIEYLGKVAQKEGYTHQMQLWMPLLPELMYIKDLQGYAGTEFDGAGWHISTGKWNLSVPVGLCDDPVNQAQMPLSIDFPRVDIWLCAAPLSAEEQPFADSAVRSDQPLRAGLAEYLCH